MNDSVADMLIQIKNGSLVNKEAVAIPYSKFLYAIAEALLREGYVSSVSKKGKRGKKIIEIGIAYSKDGVPRLHDVRRISKLSRRSYKGMKDIMPVHQGHGKLLLSTPKGILSGDEARKARVGGEALFEIW